MLSYALSIPLHAIPVSRQAFSRRAASQPFGACERRQDQGEDRRPGQRLLGGE